MVLISFYLYTCNVTKHGFDLFFIYLSSDLHLAEPKLSKPLDSSTYCCSPNLGRDDVDDVDGDVGDDVDGDDVDGDDGVDGDIGV